MQALGRIFHDDASFVNRFGRYAEGVGEIIALHAPIHASVYKDSTLENEVHKIVPIADGVVVAYIWSRLRAGEAHPAGPHTVDTLMQAVVTRAGEAWKIKAFENVTLTDPRTGKNVLRAG